MKPELATKMVEARAVLNALAITTFEGLEIKRWMELESIARAAQRLLRKKAKL